MIQLRSAEQFPLIRQLGDPADTTTYYVRAVVRNSGTGATLDTLDLTDQGSQRFTYNYQVPVDGSGKGLFIDITTTVYTDSGYTTKSEVYAEENQTYLIQERWNVAFGGGGGGGLSARQIREIFRSELERQMIPKADLRPIERELQAVSKIVSRLEVASPREIKEGVSEIKNRIDAIRIPEPEKVDFEPLMKILEKRFVSLESNFSRFGKSLISFSNLFDEGMKKLTERVQKMKFIPPVQTDAVEVHMPEKKENAESEIVRRAKRLLGL